VDKPPEKDEFDAIVVGSGPSGATIARELSKRKKKVLILERGGDEPLTEGVRTMASILRAVSVGDKLSASRAFTTGGTTAVYFAVADSPPLEIFQSLGIDLALQLEEAEKELPLAVLPDELLGAQAIRVRESAMELGFAWKKNTMLIDLSKCRSGYAYDAKWNARSYVREAVEHGAVLVTRARVVKVLLEKGRAIGVEYRLLKKKKEFELRQAFGAKIILAAGGAASPLILRESGMRNVAGRGFYCHPNLAVFGTLPGLKAGENFAASMGMEVEDGIGVGDANPARTMYRMFMLSQRRWIRAFLHSQSIGVGVMVKEGLGGELQEDGRYRKQLTKEDLEKLAKGEEIARRIISHAGAGHIFKSPVSAAHVGGAIKINEHVDANLETEYSNLHVCDGSVIPEEVKVSPALTLICLGKYLANCLAPASLSGQIGGTR
jgi:hypothetical protein